MQRFRLFLFGTPRLEFENNLVPIDTRKALALMAYLLIEGQPQSRDTLAALFWPESDQKASRAALRRTLSTLRGALDDRLFDFGRENLTLKPDQGLWCDVEIFNHQLAECHTHGHPEDQVCMLCLPHLQAATELYSADFLAGFNLHDSAKFDDWQFFEADRLRRTFAGVLENYTLLQQKMGDIPEAINAARKWLNLDTLNENAHRALIRLYALDNQRNSALRQYRECVRVLDEELGVPPLEETTNLYEAVKGNHLVELLSENKSNKLKTALTTAPQNLELISSIPIPLVGRGVEWKQINQIYEGIRLNGAFLALTGEPGIGKTHLAKEFLSQVQLHNANILSTRCYAGENNLPFTPLIDLIRQGINQIEGNNWLQGLHPHWLSEVALLVPELSEPVLDLQPAGSFEGPGAQTRFYEGVSQILTALADGPIPGVIFIDNLEWIDESSLDLLAYFVRRLQGRQILLMVAWQTENNPNTTRLDQILHDTKQQGYGFQIPLNALQTEHALELIDILEKGKQRLPIEFKQKLVESSHGLPYFLVEYMQSVMAGEIRPEMISSQWPIPNGLREMYHLRFANLSGSTPQILQTAAIIGGSFDMDLLKTVSGRPEDEIVSGIESLLSLNLIRDVTEAKSLNKTSARYDFKQDQIRSLVFNEISLVRQRLLHKRVAEALVEQPTGYRDTSGQIAYHFLQAGIPEKAAEFYFRAGNEARKLHANADALAHFEAALALETPHKTEALVATGDLHTLLGNYPQAIQQYEAAAAFSTPASLPPIEQKIGQIYLRRGCWEEAASHFEAALYDLNALPTSQQKAFEAEIRADWSLAYYREGKKDLVWNLAQTAQDLAEASADPLALAQVYNLLGILARSEGNSKLALEHLAKSISYAIQLDNPAAHIATLNNLALAQTDQGEYDKAINTLEEALNDCQNIGDRHLEAALRNNLADLLRANGQWQASISQLKQAVVIFAEIGQNVEEWEPEIWKLVEW